MTLLKPDLSVGRNLWRTAASAECARLRASFVSGNIDDIVRRRARIARIVMEAPRAQRIRAGDPLIVELRTLWAAASLGWYDREGAREALAPYLKAATERGKAYVTLLDWNTTDEPTLKAYVGAVAAQVLYRFKQYSDARRMAEYALNEFEIQTRELTAVDELRQAECVIWLSRIQLRESERLAASSLYSSRRSIVSVRADAEDQLMRATRGLIARYGSAGDAGGVDVLVAQGLMHLSELDLTRGNHDDARRRVYMALSTLRRKRVRNRIGLAFALELAARLEAARDEDFALPVQLATESLSLLDPIGHVFRYRVRGLLAQVYRKAGQHDEAGRVIERLSSRDDADTSYERRHAQADALLAMIWQQEEQAADATMRGDPIAQPLWAECRASAVRLKSAVSANPAQEMSTLLQVEAILHHGIALVGVGELTAGRSEITEARRRANDMQMLYVEARAYMALAESHLMDSSRTSSDRHRAAFDAVDAADTVLRGRQPTAFLRRLRERVLRTCTDGGTFKIDLQQPYHTILIGFRKAYAQTLLANNDQDIDKAIKSTERHPGERMTKERLKAMLAGTDYREGKTRKRKSTRT